MSSNTPQPVSQDPFMHAFRLETNHDNRGFTVENRITVAGAPPRGWAQFEAIAVIGIREVSAIGDRRTMPHEVRAPMVGVADIGEAFRRFVEFVEPACKMYLEDLQRRSAERSRIIPANIVPPTQVPGQG